MTQEETWNNAVTRSDGTYTLPIGNDLPYNVMVYDNTGKWVAAALAGVQGQKNATIHTANLVLTEGAIIQGTVTDTAGHPVIGQAGTVSTYNPSRPNSSAGCDSVAADSHGHYRIRVAPGTCMVYTADGGTGFKEKTVTVAPGDVKTVNLVTPFSS